MIIEKLFLKLYPTFALQWKVSVWPLGAVWWVPLENFHNNFKTPSELQIKYTVRKYYSIFLNSITGIAM